MTGARPAVVLLSNKFRGSIPDVKLPEHEANHSSTSVAKVKRMWSYISTPPYVSFTVPY
jgi:hypothetical protein